ncbi:MAG: 2Fe-2S iron-sulfur cluster-binding protein [Alphaproteobacteria bacterium]
MSAFTVVLAKTGVTLEVPEEKSLLEVFEENNIPVGYSCRAGTCGTCGVRVISGDIEHYDEVMQPWEQAQNKLMMSCVSRCKGELVLDL